MNDTQWKIQTAEDIAKLFFCSIRRCINDAGSMITVDGGATSSIFLDFLAEMINTIAIIAATEKTGKVHHMILIYQK